MGDCIDLTLDSDEEAAPQTSRPVPTKRRLPSPSTEDDDVIVVEDGPAKRARQEPAEQQEPVDPDAEVVVTAETGDVSMGLAGLPGCMRPSPAAAVSYDLVCCVCCAQVALRDYPHSRDTCGTKPFKKGVEASNSTTCTNVRASQLATAQQMHASCDRSRHAV
jgi:hypothetical protein